MCKKNHQYLLPQPRCRLHSYGYPQFYKDCNDGVRLSHFDVDNNNNTKNNQQQPTSQTYFTPITPNKPATSVRSNDENTFRMWLTSLFMGKRRLGAVVAAACICCIKASSYAQNSLKPHLIPCVFPECWLGGLT